MSFMYLSKESLSISRAHFLFIFSLIPIRLPDYSKFTSKKSASGPENSVAAALLREGKLTKKAEADLRRMQKAEARERRGELKKGKGSKCFFKSKALLLVSF